MQNDGTSSNEKTAGQDGPHGNPEIDAEGSPAGNADAPKAPGIAIKTALRAGYVSSNGGKQP